MKCKFVFIALLLVGCLGCSNNSSNSEESSSSYTSDLFSSNSNKLTADDVEFSLMSWNIYLGKGDPKAVVRTIKDAAPDIINFQEAKGSYDKFIEPLLQEETQYVLVNDTVPGGAPVCSTPILFDQNKFNYIDSGAEMLKDAYYPGVDTKSLSYVVLEDKDTEKMFFVINFHGAILKTSYEGYEHYSDEEITNLVNEYRKGNVQQILDKFDELKELYGDCPSIFSGDCNFDSESIAYELASDSGFEDAEVSALFEKNNDGLQTRHTLGGKPEKGLTIDHVFADSKVEFINHYIIRNDVSYAASDHDAVLVDIYLKG